MESRHHTFVEDTIPLMNVQARDRVLQVGCGEGEACRRLAPLAREGLVLGLDISDERIRKARAQSVAHENLLFVCASAEEIPWQENFFSKALCIDFSEYSDDSDYSDNPERALREIYRVLSPGGSLWILNRLSKENALSLRLLAESKTPVRLLSAEEYGALFEQCGYEGYSCRMIPDRTPLDETSPNPLLSDAEKLRRFRDLGALLLSARKPAV